MKVDLNNQILSTQSLLQVSQKFQNNLKFNYLYPRGHFKNKLSKPVQCLDIIKYLSSNMVQETSENV